MERPTEETGGNMCRTMKRCRFGVALLVLILVCDLISQGNVTRASGISRPKVTVGKRTKKTVILKLRSSSKVTSYQIRLKKGKKGKYSLVDFAMGTKVNWKLKKLKPKETYYVKVRSVRTRGIYPQKSAFSAVKKIPPYEKKKKKPTTPTPAPMPSAAPTVKPSAIPALATGVPSKVPAASSAADPADFPTVSPTEFSASMPAEPPAANSTESSVAVPTAQ